MTFALLALLCGAVQAQVTLSASTTTAVLAQPFVLEAKAAAPVELDLEKSTTDTYVVSHVDTTGTNDFKVTVLPLAVGKLPISLVWKQGDRSLQSQPFVLDVGLPPLEDPQLADIKPPRKARPLIWPWLLLLAALAGAYYYWDKRRKAELAAEAARPVDARPADAAALEDLEALARSPLWAEARYREFYFRLTDVVRVYLERRFGVPATKLTTSELNRQLKQAEVDRPVVTRLKDLFDRADLVKFAKIAPEASWGPRDVESARQIVTDTAPKPAPDPAQEARA